MSMITGAQPRAGISQLQRHPLPAGGGHDPLGQPLAHAGDDAGQPAAWSCRSGLKPAPRSAASTKPAAAWMPCSWPVNKLASWVGREMTPRASSALPPPSANPCSPATAGASAATCRCRPLTGITPFQVTRRAAAGGALPRPAAAIIGDRSLPGGLLAAVTVPALVITGEQSPPFLRHAAQAVAERLPNARLAVLPGQGHDINPGATAPVIAEFLAS
jgi:pimeloyl-ACP methyl ester carboxylesterase